MLSDFCFSLEIRLGLYSTGTLAERMARIEAKIAALQQSAQHIVAADGCPDCGSQKPGIHSVHCPQYVPASVLRRR